MGTDFLADFVVIGKGVMVLNLGWLIQIRYKSFFNNEGGKHWHRLPRMAAAL